MWESVQGDKGRLTWNIGLGWFVYNFGKSEWLNFKVRFRFRSVYVNVKKPRELRNLNQNKYFLALGQTI